MTQYGDLGSLRRRRIRQVERIEQAALSEENVQRFVADKTVKKIVVVPGRLVNIVVQ